jgi:hypothetical protein
MHRVLNMQQEQLQRLQAMRQLQLLRPSSALPFRCCCSLSPCLDLTDFRRYRSRNPFGAAATEFHQQLLLDQAAPNPFVHPVTSLCSPVLTDRLQTRRLTRSAHADTKATRLSASFRSPKVCLHPHSPALTEQVNRITSISSGPSLDMNRQSLPPRSPPLWFVASPLGSSVYSRS